IKQLIYPPTLQSKTKTTTYPLLPVSNLFHMQLHPLQRIQENKHRPVRLLRILPSPTIQRLERSRNPVAPRTLVRGRRHDRTRLMLHASNTESEYQTRRQHPRRRPWTNGPHPDPTTPPCNNQ